MLSSRSSSPTLVINTSNRQSNPLHLRRSLSKPLHHSHHRIPQQSLASSPHANPSSHPSPPFPGKTSQTSTLGHHAARPTGSRGRALSRSAASMQRAGGSWPHGSRHEAGLWCLRSAPLRWWPPPAEALRNRSVLVLLLHLHLLRRGVEPTLTLSCGAVSSASQNGREYG